MVIKVPLKDSLGFLRSYTSILSFIHGAQATPAEVELLHEFLLLPESFRYRRFSTPAKQKVLDVYKVKNKNLSLVNMNNKLYALLQKRLLRRDEDKVIQVPEFVLKPFLEYLQSSKSQIVLDFYEDVRKGNSGT